MRYAALGVVLGVAATSSAQLSGLRSLSKALIDQKVVEIKQNFPGGEKVIPPVIQKLPTPTDNPKELEMHYGAISGLGNEIELSDGVELIGRGYRVLADRVVGNKETEIFTCSGDVRIIGEDSTVVGESVTVDFKNRTFFATYGKAQIKPNLLQNKVQGDVFMSGKQAYGSSRKMFGIESLFTTCDLEEPHFHFDSESSTIEPKREAILKKVKINVLGHNIITLPILWIPLGDRSYKYLPQVGQSPDEGYYIKNTYGFPMRGDDRGAVRLDYMSKLGVGLGLNYYYRNKNMNGIAKIYRVFGDANTTTISNQHEQRLGWANLTVDNDIQQNNYLTAPGTTITNTRAQLRFPKYTTISFNQQGQTSAAIGAQPAYNSYNQTFTINDSRQWGKTSTSFDMTMNRSGGSSGYSRQTVDVRFNGSQDVKQGVISLDYQRTIPVGEVQNFFPGSDRTPVLSFRTDSSKLFGPNTLKTLPFRTELSIGEFLDPILKQRISRSMFDLSFNRATRDKGNWRWDFNGNFRQNMYSDDTAQYRLTFGNGLSYSLGQKLSLNLRYSYLRPFGYSPLAIDRTGQTNVATADFSWQKNSKSSFGIQTGYDFIRGDTGDVAWQQIGIRTEYKLGNSFNLRTLSSYDTFQQSWSNIRIDSTWQTPTLSATFGARFDAIQHKWSNFNAYIDGIQSGKTRIGAILNFNGYSGRLDSQQYNLVYDLHCAEMVLTLADYGTGFRAGREIGLFIRLKAIPFDSNFGRGRLGQLLGGGSGRDF